MSVSLSASDILIVPNGYLDNVHPHTADELAQKRRGIDMPLETFKLVMRLIRLAETYLAMPLAKGRDPKVQETLEEQFYVIDHVAEYADAIATMNGESDRLLLLSKSDVDALHSVISMARQELNESGDTSIDGGQGEIPLTPADLDNVAATLWATIRLVRF